MRSELLRYLRCPLCAGELVAGADQPGADQPGAAGAVRCSRGHSFDVARQGYLNLLTEQAPIAGDTAQMVAARAEVFAAGHFDFLTEAIVTTATAEGTVAVDPAGCAADLAVDVGASPGGHLAAVLDALPTYEGIALDLAKPAVRRAARAHPRMGAVVCDVWRGLPVADGCADLLLDVFAPRNGPEFRRVLRPDGVAVVVTPRADHLGEIVGPLGLIGVDPDKENRVARSLERWLQPQDEREYATTLVLSRPDVVRLVGMGPSARHVDPAQLNERVATLPEPVEVTAAVRVTPFSPRPDAK